MVPVYLTECKALPCIMQQMLFMTTSTLADLWPTIAATDKGYKYKELSVSTSHNCYYELQVQEMGSIWIVNL